MIKKLFSHTLIYGLAPQVTKVASIASLPIITQYLTPVDYGVYGVLTAYTTSITVLASLGIRTVLVNSFYKSPSQYKWAWRQLYGFLRLWSLLFAGVMALMVWLVIPAEAEEHKWLVLFLNVTPAIFFGQTALFATTYFQVAQKPMQIALRSAIFGLLAIGLNVLFIAEYRLGYMGWFLASFIVGNLSNLSYWFVLTQRLKIKPIFNFKWRLINQSLKISLPTVPHFYSGYLLDTSDRVVMNVLKVGTGDIGKYNAAYTVANIFKKFGNAAGLAVGPLMFERFKANDYITARNLVFVLQTCFLLGAFVASIWLKEIFAFLIRNDELSKMYTLGICIVMSYSYRPMYFGVINLIQFHEKTNMSWKLTLTAGLINVALNFLLLPLFGFEAAAYTTFAALMFMGYAGFAYPTFRKLNTVRYYPVIWFLLTCGLTIASYLAVELPIPIKILITIILGLITVLLYRKYKQMSIGEKAS